MLETKRISDTTGAFLNPTVFGGCRHRTGNVGTSEAAAGARVCLQLSPFSLPAEGATSERRGAGEAGTRGGDWGREQVGGRRADGRQCRGAPARFRLARTPPLFVHSALPAAARSPPAHASLFSESEAPQQPRREPSAQSAVGRRG